MASALHITGHAIERYQERVANLPDDRVRELLSAPAIQQAADFGAHYVRLGTGHRVVIENSSVVTVLPARDVNPLIVQHWRQQAQR